MTFFLNAINKLRHPEEAQSAVSKDATIVMQPASRRVRAGRALSAYCRRSDIAHL
jgi:hypothetical protein